MAKQTLGCVLGEPAMNGSCVATKQIRGNESRCLETDEIPLLGEFFVRS